MLSVRFDQFGKPTDVLHVEEQPKPTPGNGEVLVRMQARPIHPSDLLMVRGLYGSLPMLPSTPGGEGMGIIEAVGPQVQSWQVGQRVIPFGGTSGTWQECLIAKANQMLPIPDTVSNEAAAQFIINLSTPWVMTTKVLNLEPGQWLLQTAAGSTVGRIVLQIAKLRGFKTINVVRRRAQVEELKALGADEVICTADEDLVARVMEITENTGVPAAIDSVGGQVGAGVARSLGRHGVMLSYGCLSEEPIPLDVRQLIFRGCTTVQGFWLIDWFRSTPIEKQQAVSAELLELMAAGKIEPSVEAKYPLKDVLKAVQHAERSGRQGKVLLID